VANAARKLKVRTKINIFEQLLGIIHGYNVEWLSEASGVAQATIYFWLDGTTTRPRLDTISKVAKVVGYRLCLTRDSAPRLRSVK